MTNYYISKAVDKNAVYYTIRWSPITKAEKYSILGSVPAMGGMAELYYMDAKGKLNLYMIARSYYGGLRASLRTATDPETEKDDKNRAILLSHEDKIYYRYSLIESKDDMSDIMYFYLSTYLPHKKHSHSGRYKNIFVSEADSGKLVSLY